MRKLSLLLIPAALLTLALAQGTRKADAGTSYPPSGGCNSGKGTSMRCWGTLRGFRLSANPSTYARFYSQYESDGLYHRNFSASFNGLDYGCTVAPNTIDEATWAQLTANPDMYFVIQAGPDFACHLDQLSADSAYLP